MPIEDTRHNPSHRPRSLENIGGFLRGETFDLDAGLDCIIGARGTGKNTVLEGAFEQVFRSHVTDNNGD